MPLQNVPSFYFKNTTNSALATQTNNIQTPTLQKNIKSTDGFAKKGLSIGVKIAIGTSIIAVLAGGIYLVKSGKAKKAYEAVKKFFNKENKQIAKNVKEMKIIPEKIEIPKNGKYDISKEFPLAFYQSNTMQYGFSPHYVDSTGTISLSSINSDEAKLLRQLGECGNYGRFGIKDGHAYVKYVIGPNGTSTGISALNPLYKKNYSNGGTLLGGFTIISPDKNFTPAQKNLLALAQQDKFSSPNAPLHMMDLPKDFKQEDIFDMIGKWSQDVDTTSKETGEFLGRLHTLKEGECVYDFNTVFKKFKITK